MPILSFYASRSLFLQVSQMVNKKRNVEQCRNRIDDIYVESLVLFVQWPRNCHLVLSVGRSLNIVRTSTAHLKLQQSINQFICILTTALSTICILLTLNCTANYPWLHIIYLQAWKQPMQSMWKYQRPNSLHFAYLLLWLT